MLDTIGDTPMVRLNRIPKGVVAAEVVAKIETFNPGNSIKDRMAVKMIEDAERDGRLKPGGTIIEGTSGNTGMGLAMVANLKRYTLTTPLSDAIPLEKRTVLRFFGSDVIELDDSLCPAPGAPASRRHPGTDGDPVER